MSKTTLIKNVSTVRRFGVEKRDVLIENGKIRFVKEAIRADEIIDGEGKYLVPGFIETHIHGLNNCDCLNGSVKVVNGVKEFEYEGAIDIILKSLPKTGVTSTMLSSYACPREKLDRFLATASKYIGKNTPGSTKLLALDMEGNFLKDPAFSGAQDPKNTLSPTIETFKVLQGLANGHIKKALIAPEWGEEAFQLIKYMAEEGGLPSVGHTGCTRDELLRAYDCGTRVVVHTGNGPMSQNFKAGGALDGIFELGPKLYGEIICDMCHVHPRWVNTFINCYSLDRTIAVSDTLRYAGTGLKEGDEIEGMVFKNGAMWVAAKANTLAGSVSTLDVQYVNMINLFTSDRKAYFQTEIAAPYDLDTALVKLSRMYSYNQACMLNVDSVTGSIDDGKSADILLMAVHGTAGKHSIRIERTFIDGVS
ncbi:MAG: amidohydrolase family protein [Fibrobacteres bacterium]|nr:amidohydrolase family protein [Fibrobacterota bacterium]